MKAPIKLGRKFIFETPDDLLECFLDYIDDCISENDLPNMAGFRANKVIPKSTLFEYERRENFSDVFNIIKDILEDKTINNKFCDSQIKKLVLQSKFNYSDKIQTENMNVNAEVIDLEEMKARMIEKYFKPIQE